MNLSQQEWTDQLENDQNAIVIDVRTDDEYNDGMIPGALNLDIYKGQGFIYRLDELDKTKNFYVYCKAGSRSEQACSIMKQLGFDNTFNLQGGFMQWRGSVEIPK